MPQRILRDDGILDQVLKLDLNVPLPPPLSIHCEPVTIPDLPTVAQLSTEATLAAEGAAGWLDEFLTRAMTPCTFLGANRIWTLGLAIARLLLRSSPCAQLLAPLHPVDSAHLNFQENHRHGCDCRPGEHHHAHMLQV